MRAVVTVGSNGKAATVGTPGSDENLGEEVRDALTDGTSYLESCKGKALEVVFTFRLEGLPTEYPMTFVLFQPPNHFTIVSEPKKPHFVYDKDQPPKK